MEPKMTKGTVVAVHRFDRKGDAVQIWIKSPLQASENDTLSFVIPCESAGQAKLVAAMWRETWGL